MNAQPSPPSPAVADLEDRLRRTLDPAVPVAEKPLRIAGDDKDPELITRISRVYAPVTTTVVDATEVGPGQPLATTVLGSPERRVPTIVPFVAREGSWRLAPAGPARRSSRPASPPRLPVTAHADLPIRRRNATPGGKVEVRQVSAKERDTWWTRPTELPRATAA
ncbi:hypothetical protein ACWEKR_15480 [Nocardia sp. NPDC004573]